MNVRRNTAWALLGSVASGPVVLLSAVVLARGLSPEDHGRVQAVLSLLLVAGSLGNAGQVGATVQAVASGRAPPGRAVTTGLLGVSLAGAGLAVGAGLGGDVLRERILLGASPEVLGLAVLALFPQLWTGVWGGAARGLDRFGVWTATELTTKVGRLLAFGGLALTDRLHVGSALAAVVAVEGLACGVATAGVVGRLGAPGTSPGELWEAARFGLGSWATTALGQLHERMDLVLLAWLRGDPAEVAAYAVAVNVVNRLRTLPLAQSSALHPAVAADPVQGGILARRTAWEALGASVGTGLAVAIVVPWALPWVFGPAYAASVLPAWVLLPGTVAWSLYVVLARWFQGVDRQGVNLGVVGLATLVNLVLNLLWIPDHGALGAAAASLVSYTLQGGGLAAAFVARGPR